MGAVPWDAMSPVGADWDLDGFAAWLGGRSAATRKAYTSDLRAFAEWMARSDVDAPGGVDRLHLRRYLASLGTRKLARATVARKAAALRCYFSWLTRQGRLEADPARALCGSVGRRAPAPGAVGRRDRHAARRRRRQRPRAARPGRARAALRRRAARLGAVRARPGGHRPARAGP